MEWRLALCQNNLPLPQGLLDEPVVNSDGGSGPRLVARVAREATEGALPPSSTCEATTALVQAVPVGQGHRLEAAVHVELAEDVLHVIADRGRAHVQSLGEHLRIGSGGHEPQDLKFSLGQAAETLTAGRPDGHELRPGTLQELSYRRDVTEQMDDHGRSPVRLRRL